MKCYDLIPENEIQQLPKIHTKVEFIIGSNTKCVEILQANSFSFNRLIPVPYMHNILSGPDIEKALAAYMTNGGRSDHNNLNFQSENEEMLKYANLPIPKDYFNWYFKCMAECSDKQIQDYSSMGFMCYDCYASTKTFTEVGFRAKYWGTPEDVIRFSSRFSNNLAVIDFTTLGKPPLPWLITLSRLFPAIKFSIFVDTSKGTQISYELKWGNLKKDSEYPIKNNKPQGNTNTMNVF